MNLAATVKKAPRWAWYVAAGTGVGVAGIKLWKHRAAPPSTQTATTTDPNTGAAYVGQASPGGNPPGVIVPPIIVGNQTDPNAGNANSLAALYVQALGGVQQQSSDIITALLSSAGSAPAPAVQNPSPVGAAPPPQPAPVAPHAKPAGCPPGYMRNPANGKCYKNCAHDECHGHALKRNHGHCYQDGSRVGVTMEDLHRKC